MAGNIIHAIATTNASVAGLQVLELFKIVSSQIDKCFISSVAIPGNNSAYTLVGAQQMAKKNPCCPACGQARLSLKL